MKNNVGSRKNSMDDHIKVLGIVGSYRKGGIIDTAIDEILASAKEEGAERKYDIILANPPFAGNVNKEAILEDFDLRTSKTELLFGEYFYKHLVPGGKAAVIVPEGVLFGSTNAHKKLRTWLLDECRIHGIISLPSGVFKPYAGVKTSVIVFERGGKTDKVWFYEITADGFSLDDKRNPHPDQNDIPDLIGKWETKIESERSWYVERKEIDENDLNLTAAAINLMFMKRLSIRSQRILFQRSWR
jgi:type I restriction enzyme M protein